MAKNVDEIYTSHRYTFTLNEKNTATYTLSFLLAILVIVYVVFLCCTL